MQVQGAMSGNNSQQQFPPMQEGDDRLFVQFYMGSVPDPKATEEQGHPVFLSVPFIKILVPGDKNTVVDTKVDASHKRRFARLWSQFSANEEQTLSGMPLRDWPVITRAQAEELAYLNIVTVEQLSVCSDAFAHRIMNFNVLKRKATAYLDNAKDASSSLRLVEENGKLRDQIEALQVEMARLSASFSEMQKSHTGGRKDGK
jgi:hypothetical protein